MDALVDETVSSPGGSVTGATAGGEGSEAEEAAGDTAARGGPVRDQERGFESAREDRPAGGTPRDVGTGMSTSARGGEAARRERGGGQGLSPWFGGAENPLAMMRRMQEDLDRVFNVFGIPRLAFGAIPTRDLEELLARSPAVARTAQWSPQVEVVERGDALVVRADLPGVKRDDVEVNVENDVLTIRGQRREEHREAEGGYRRTERSYGTFFRQIPLPEGVEPDRIEASYEDGVLEVTIPSPRETPRGRRRIDIR
jgi:HSP20 family protein